MDHCELSISDIEALLTHYRVGDLQAIHPLTAGTVQTNLRLTTTAGDFVLRLYRQNRSFDAVRFEVNVVNYLTRQGYPCPAVVRRRQGDYVGWYSEQPYALFHFVEGAHVAEPTPTQQRQLITKVAELQALTQGYRPAQVAARWNYNATFCDWLAGEKAAQIGEANAAAKLAWYRQTLAQLQLPANHPKGICHCDFHFSNVLFKDGNFHALLDFDDANYTYLTFDLVSLIEPVLFPFQWDNWQAVSPESVRFDFVAARAIIDTYQAVRPLNAVEQHHFFDVLKLATLIDCLWYFARGEVDGFYERRKIESLDAVGRAAFTAALFAPCGP
jgi:Ser/Thr protein kinase RdoA (MazF antagonist)